MSALTDRARELACQFCDIDIDQIEDYGTDAIAKVMKIAESALQREWDEGYAAGYNAEQGDLAMLLKRERDEAAERAVTWMQANIAKHNLSDQGLRAAIQGSEPQGEHGPECDCDSCRDIAAFDVAGFFGTKKSERPAPTGGEANLLDIFVWLLGYTDLPPSEPERRYSWRSDLRGKLKAIGIFDAVTDRANALASSASAEEGEG